MTDEELANAKAILKFWPRNATRFPCECDPKARGGCTTKMVRCNRRLNAMREFAIAEWRKAGSPTAPSPGESMT